MEGCIAGCGCATGWKRIGDRVLGKLRRFCYFGVGVILVFLIAGCGGGSNENQGTVEILSGDALNPEVSALARRRRIGGTTLKILFNGDFRPDRPVPLAEMIESFRSLPGNHLVEFELHNKRGQVIARGTQQASVLIGFVHTTELVFDPPDCGAMSDLTCQTSAEVTPATVLANAETEQCVMVDNAMSPVHHLLICIPPGILEVDTTVEVTEVYNIPSGMPDHLSQAGVIVNIRFDPEPFLNQPITLHFPYDEELVATGEQNLGINEADLNLFQLNSRAGQWVPLPGQLAPNTDSNMVMAQSDSLGFFVVGGPVPDAGNPPVANHQIVTTFVNTSVPITLTGSDADGDPILFRVVSSPERGHFDLTSNDVSEDDVLDGVLVVPERAVLVYTPELNFFGQDTFLFEAEEISDAGLSSILAMVTIQVNPRQSFVACVLAELGPGDKCMSTSLMGAVVGASPVAVAVADLNGDLIPDLITANSESNDISVLLGQDDMSFSAPQRFPVGNTPVAVVVADFNGDGIPDLATANSESNDVTILLGQPNDASPLNFAVQPGFPVGASPSDIAVDDFNRDAVPDLVTANFNSFNVSVIFGNRTNGIFTLENPQTVEVGAKPSAVAVADINNDGILDIVTANPLNVDNVTAANKITVLIGQPDGSFSPDPMMYPVGDAPLSLAVADVDNDGFVDLITANNGSDDVSVLTRESDGTFVEEKRFPVGREPRDVVVADFNADDKLDLATANGVTHNVSVLLGLGNGSFLAEQGFGVGENPSSLAVADIDRDGTLDLVTADQFSHSVTGLLGNGDGTFPAIQGIGVGARPQAVAADDLDSNGRLDLATANLDSNDVTVLHQQCNGTFETPASFPLVGAAFGPRDVVIADLENDDAVLDMVTANAGVDDNPSTTVSLLFGDPPDGFIVESMDADSMRQGAVAVGDLNGDTLPDLVTASFGTDGEPTNRVYVLLAQGIERYRLLPTPAILVGTSPQDVELGDFNGDGQLDLVTANAKTNDVSVVFGLRNSNFNPDSKKDFAVGERPVAVAIEDLNSDGFLDLVVANADDHNVSILLG